MKKWIVGFTMMLMMLCFGTTECKAETYSGTCGAQGDNLTWILDEEGTLTITGIGQMNYYRTAPWSEYSNSVKKVVIENGVINIADSAFFGCRNLTDIVIPESVSSIGKSAFWSCKSLESIVLPDNLRSIGKNAFTGCDTLDSVFIPDGLTAVEESSFEIYTTVYAHLDTDGAKAVSKAGLSFKVQDGNIYLRYIYSEDEVEGLEVVRADEGVTTVDIPEEVTSIGYCAFYNSYSLTAITIPDSVENIGSHAFYYCNNLTSINIPSGVSVIRDNTFKGCSQLVSISIPGSVTGIESDAFADCSSLKEIDLPKDVTIIGEGAFSGCTNLQSITIPAGVTSIEQSTFYKCNNLETVILPANLTSIGSCAFYECRTLSDINIPAKVISIDKQAFQSCSSLKKLTIPENLVSIGENAFNACSAELYVNLGTEGARTVSRYGYPFRECEGLIDYKYIFSEDTIVGLLVEGADKEITEADLPEEVTSIRDYAFSNCTKLRSITIPDGVDHIGEYTFRFCSNLTDIHFSEDITNIGENAFQGCSSLTEVDLPGKVTSIGDYAFDNCNSLENITIPKGVTNIGAYAFNCCSSLNGITVPDGVTAISEYTFNGCSELERVDLPTSLTDIGNHAFSDCEKLNGIIFPEGLTNIDTNAFRNCKSLNDIEIPEGITSIPDYAFYFCTNLSDISIPEGITSIGDYAFYNCGFTSINVPNELESLGQFAFTGQNIVLYANLDTKGSKTVSRKNYAFVEPEGEISLRYIYDGDEIKGLEVTSANKDITEVRFPDSVTRISSSAFINCNKLVDVSIPKGVMEIQSSAFSGCISLENITVPDGVTSIEAHTFNGCRELKNVDLPHSITSIGYQAFAYCSNLKELIIPEGVMNIESAAFYGCDSLKSINIPKGVKTIRSSLCGNCTSLESIVIPNGVTDIENSAFYNCKITKLEIPDSVTNIGDRAFYMPSISTTVFIWGDEIHLKDESFWGISMVYCYEYSDADYWAADKGYPVTYLDHLDIGSIRVITLPDSLRLICGTAREIPINVFPNKDNPEIIWSSTNTSVITVENGVATANIPGSSTITVTVGGTSASMEITSYILAEDFEIQNEIWVLAKKTAQLEVNNIVPQDAETDIIWSSSDESIATVDSSGLVTGKKPGDAVITAKDIGGVIKQATAHICYPVTSIELQFDDTIYVGQSSQLTANVTMRTQSCVNKLVSFTSSDETIATIDDNGLIKALKAGTVEITVEAESGISTTGTIVIKECEAVLTLPSNLTSIDSEAFANLESVDGVRIPASVVNIADDAFKNSVIVIIAPVDSYAIEWAKGHDIPYIEE